MINIQPIEAVVKNAAKLEVHSIFHSIQGEGPHAGRPAIFIRLAGCNLRCPACDTDYTSIRQALTHREIFDQASKFGWRGDGYRPLIVITGGEPLRQPIEELVDIFIAHFYEVQIETNGTLWREGLLPFLKNKRLSIVCSPKTPSIHPDIVEHICAFKYIVRDDSLISANGLPKRPLSHPSTASIKKGVFHPTSIETKHIYLQPQDDKDPAKNKANLEEVKRLCLKHGYRVCVQLHKILDME